MVALQVRRLSDEGFHVLQLDLAGCGDSGGDFGEATWSTWLDDIHLAIDWLRKQTDAPFWLWGMRVGALLAAEAGRGCSFPFNYLLWQPVTSGVLGLQQILRMGAAAEMLEGGKGSTRRLKAELAAGHSVEIAGYRISPALAAGLETASFKPAAGNGRLVWLDVSGQANREASPSTAASLTEWQQSGFKTLYQSVTGPAFWQIPESEIATGLIDATLAALVSER